MAVSVTIQGLTKRFDGVRAVDAVDLRIEAGELFFLLGPSGCGKTTLLRCIAGFHDPDEGRILFDDREITHDPPHERDTGMVFQSYALWPHLSVRENVAFGLQTRHVPRPDIRRRVDEALERVRMLERADAKPNQLSGGQQQRVALARALVVQPRCLLLDEPLSNLDAKLRLDMRGEIRRICKDAGLTAIYVTHDQKEALSIADRLAVLDKGRIRQLGTPDEVYQRPNSRFVAGFIGETNFIEGFVRGRADAFWKVETAIGEWLGTSVEPLATDQPVVLSIRPEALRLLDEASGAPNVFAGVSHDTVYLGEVAQHGVDVTGADTQRLTFKVFELHPRRILRDRPLPCGLTASPDDVAILRAEG